MSRRSADRKKRARPRKPKQTRRVDPKPAAAPTGATRMRTCVGCMTRDRKEAMVRIVGSERGLVPDFGARAPGRGGYLHPRTECMERFLKSRAREFRSLRMKIDRDQRSSIIEAIRGRLDREPSLE